MKNIKKQKIGTKNKKKTYISLFNYSKRKITTKKN